MNTHVEEKNKSSYSSEKAIYILVSFFLHGLFWLLLFFSKGYVLRTFNKFFYQTFFTRKCLVTYYEAWMEIQQLPLFHINYEHFADFPFISVTQEYYSQLRKNYFFIITNYIIVHTKQYRSRFNNLTRLIIGYFCTLKFCRWCCKQQFIFIPDTQDFRKTNSISAILCDIM